MSVGGTWFTARWRRRAGSALVGLALVFASPALADPGIASTPIAGWSTNGTVYAVELVGDTLYLGGSFTQMRSANGASTAPRANVAAISIATGEILPFRADTNNTVRAIASDGTTVWIGGFFSTIGGTYQRRVAAVDAATGALRPSFHPDPDAILYSLAYSAEHNALYVGGAFTSVDGVPAARLAKLDPATGAPDPYFQAGGEGTVRALAVANGRLWAGGAFTAIGGTARRFMSEIDPNTGAANGPALASVGAAVLAVDAEPSGTGVFAAIAGSQNRAQAWDADTGVRRWYQVAMGDAQAVTYRNGTVYFGFHEGFDGDTSVRLLAADSQTGALDPGFRPSIDTFFGVWTLDASPVGVAAGGTFTTVSGVPTAGVAMFPADQDVTPPTAPGSPQLISASATTIELAWPASTDNGAVTYTVYRDGVGVGSSPVARYLDAGLSPDTAHTYAVKASDAAGNQSPVSPSATFSTTADKTPPTIPTSVTASVVEATSVTLQWDAAIDDVGVAGYEITRDGLVLAATAGLSYTDPTVAPESEYVYAVRAHDDAGNYGAASPPLTVTTPSLPDSDPPTTPRSLHSVSVSSTSISLVWDVSTDDDMVAGYRIERDGVEVGVATGPAAIDVGLAPEVTYSYRVAAFDPAGNLSGWSEAVVISTAPDTTPPSSPSISNAVPVGAISVSLAWSASTDDVGVIGYEVSRAGVNVGSTLETVFLDEGLTPGATYEYVVSAVDAAGHRSASSPVSVTLPATDIALVRAGSAWRYLDDGSDQGSAWFAPAFDDGSWSTGLGELGYGDGDEVTVVASGPPRSFHATTYFRADFDIASVAGVSELELRVKRDDGVLVRINGVEVARDNVGLGVVTYQTWAPSGVNGNAENAWLSFAVPPSVLVPGRNVIAVEVHQNSPRSSDLSFDLELVANPA